jgi:hypothetical protein
MNSCDEENLIVLIPLAIPMIQIELRIVIVPVEDLAEGKEQRQIV